MTQESETRQHSLSRPVRDGPALSLSSIVKLSQLITAFFFSNTYDNYSLIYLS